MPGLLVACVLGAALGCASAKLKILQPVVRPSQITLVVKRGPHLTVSGKRLRALRKLVNESLSADGLHIVDHLGPGVAQVVGTIERDDPGNRTVRLFFGFLGFGGGEFASNWALSTPEGDPTGECEVRGSVYVAGDYDDVLKAAMHRVSECLLAPNR